MSEDSKVSDNHGFFQPLLALRGAIGGVLMGLANLVPGISGGTMLLAAGIYPQFIRAIAEVTTFKFRPRSVLVLGSVVLAAGLAILLLAGSVKDLVVDHRWIMYSLFIGLTLGGVPVVWTMIRKSTPAVWGGVVVGFLAMAALALLQQSGSSEVGGEASTPWMLGLAGMAGASAMILPGVSGGYLLLVLGQYIPILTGIDHFKEALKGGAWSDAISVGLSLGLPVGIGVLVGIVVVSNLLRFLLKRFEKATLGVLLGLLLGAVVGLWPFQQGEAPALGDTVKGQIVTEATLSDLDPEDYPTVFFSPTAKHVGLSVGLIFLGFLGTLAISRFGQDSEAVESDEQGQPYRTS